MNMVFNINVIVFIALGSLVSVHGYTYSDETSLHTALSTDYDSVVRPDKQTSIGLHFGLMSISELDIVSQEFAVNGFVRAHWSDSRLTWNPASYGGINETKIKFSSVWTPSLLVANSADAIRVINDDSNLESIYLHVSMFGEVYWLTPISMRTQCSVNIQTYPFDSHSCSIKISSWMFSVDELYFYSEYERINQDLYSENGEWQITSTSIANVSRVLLGHPISAVGFTVRVSRKYSYYVITMILPVTVLGFLAPFQFLLPVESGEQNGYSLTVLLSLSVVMTLVAESIPPTATYISILSVYLLVTYILCSCQTVYSVLMTRYHFFTVRGYLLDNRTNRLTYLLAKLTFYRRPNEHNKESTDSRSPNIVVDKDSDAVARVKGMKAGLDTDDGTSERSDADIVYTYEEFVHVFNNLNFSIYFILTCLITAVFMSLLKM